MVRKPQKFSPAARYNTTTQLNTTLMYAKKSRAQRAQKNLSKILVISKSLKKTLGAIINHNEIRYFFISSL